MENFFFFDEQYGVKWYKCLNCGALQRDHIPRICPICEGRRIVRGEPEKDVGDISPVGSVGASAMQRCPLDTRTVLDVPRVGDDALDVPPENPKRI